MDPRELTDAQFVRAVEIIQSLPKTGPIQTGYEEKLTMYSLYKQATTGNVQGPRPGMWDMLGRAKWDAWAKHKDLDSTEAKWLYVEALLKVLRRYSDATIARDLVRELESYGDPSGLVMSEGSFSRAHGSDSSSDSGEEQAHPVYRSTQFPQQPGMPTGLAPQPEEFEEDDDESSDEEDPARQQPLPVMPTPSDAARVRSPSSQHSAPHKYRTPMSGSLMMTPTQAPPVPPMQPYPGFETPSAFAGPSSSAGPPSSLSGSAYGAPPLASPTYPYQPATGYRRPPSAPGMGTPMRPHPLDAAYGRPHSALALERAVEGVQAHLAALSERLDALEAHVLRASGGLISPRVGGGGSLAPGGRGSPYGHGGRGAGAFDDLGLWSHVARLLLGGLRAARAGLARALSSDGRSPALIVIRRLFLDLSFVFAVLALLRAAWRRSGVRRREIGSALGVLWRAVAGHEPPRALVSRGV